MKAMMGIGVVVAVLGSMSTQALADDDERYYGYCSMRDRADKQTLYFSDIHRAKPVGEISTRFFNYLKANYNIKNHISPSCQTWYGSYQEADDARNKDIASARRSPYDIVVRLVDWRYSGN